MPSCPTAWQFNIAGDVGLADAPEVLGQMWAFLEHRTDYGNP